MHLLVILEATVIVVDVNEPVTDSQGSVFRESATQVDVRVDGQIRADAESAKVCRCRHRPFPLLAEMLSESSSKEWFRPILTLVSASYASHHELDP